MKNLGYLALLSLGLLISAPAARATAASTPTFSTGTGTYYIPPTVTISDAASCAVIHYTTNGSTPTTSSPVYSSPLRITTTTTLKAMAICSGGSASGVGSDTYTIAAPYTPTFSTGTGTYLVPPSVVISEGTRCATVYYTTDGSTPTTASKVYSGAIRISTTTTLKAVAQCSGGYYSGVGSATYTIATAVSPRIGLAPGTYNRSISITMTDATPGAVIYYTTDGTTPTTASTVYTGAVALSNTNSFSRSYTVRAVAAYPGGYTSGVSSASYTILAATLPIHLPNSSPSFFGMSVVGLLNGTPWPEVPVGSFRINGETTLWATANPSRGSYNWSSLDHAIQIARSNGAQVLYTFNGTPPWAIAANVSISQISRSGNVVTVTTSQPHHMYYNPTYSAGEQSSITISGVSDSSYNGTFLLTGTPSATTLTYSQAGANSASSGGLVHAVCGGDKAPIACAEAPENLSDWDNFVTEIVSHVGPGVIKYWELWNEANIAHSWRGDPALLVSMAANAYRIIKAADPNAVVLSPSTTIELETPALCAGYDKRCGSAWTNRWLAAGGKNSIDGIAFHGYPMVNESPEQIQGALTLMQIAMNQNGVGSLPMIDTESSWSLNASLPAASDQVAFLGRHLLLEQSMGVQRVFWYAYDDAQWGLLWTATAGLNDPGYAYGQIKKWIVGTSRTQTCAPVALNSNTYTCGYARLNGYNALAVWSKSGSGTFTVPAGYVQYRDLYGTLRPTSAGSTLSITSSPILLENKSVF